MRLSRTWTLLVLASAALLIVAACSAGSSSSPSSAPNGIAISEAWVRPPMGTDRPAGGYLTITNTGPQADALIAVSSPIASSVEIHETMTDAAGTMGMQPVDKIDVPAGATVALEPGGYHLMLMRVTDMPAVGETVQLTLTFEKAGDVVVHAEVKAG